MNVTIQEQDGNMVAILKGNLNTAVAAALVTGTGTWV